jgi:hypothetical protein
VSNLQGAVLSVSRDYRYTLTREWDQGGGTLNVIGLNPSTADETQDDPTIRRCVGFAKRWRFGRLVMTNLFAFRSTAPARLYEAADPIGPENDTHLLEEARKASEVLCAWGAHGKLHGRGAAVAEALTIAHVRLNVFGLKSSAEPSPWINIFRSTHGGL